VPSLFCLLVKNKPNIQRRPYSLLELSIDTYSKRYVLCAQVCHNQPVGIIIIFAIILQLHYMLCINNVIKLCHCLSGSFFCFQVLTAFALLTTIFKCLLNKQCAR
jgi:hypothetical protein